MISISDSIAIGHGRFQFRAKDGFWSRMEGVLVAQNGKLFGLIYTPEGPEWKHIADLPEPTEYGPALREAAADGEGEPNG
jgi:hypothetical protein